MRTALAMTRVTGCVSAAAERMNAFGRGATALRSTRRMQGWRRQKG